VMLYNNRMGFAHVKQMKGYQGFDVNGSRVLSVPNNAGWFAVDSVDITGVRAIALQVGWQKAPVDGYDFEIHLDTPDGKLLGTINLPAPPQIKSDKTKMGNTMINGSISALTDGKLHNIYVVSKPKKVGSSDQVGLQWIEFKP